MRTLAWAFAAVALVAAGCVTKGTHLKLKKELDDQIAGLQGSLQAKTNECKTLFANLSACSARKAELETQLARTRETLDKAQRNLVVCQDMVRGKSEKLGELRDALMKKEEDLRKKAEEIALKERALLDSIDRINRLERQVSRLRAIFDDLQNKLAALVKAGKLTVKMVKGNLVVQLPERILFALGSATVKKEGTEAITDVVEFLKNMKHRWQVVGHTDSTGAAKGNWQLSTKRALAVLTVMLKAGMPPELVSAAGAGQYQPVASNDDEESRSQNRRTEMLLVPDLEELLAPVRGGPPAPPTPAS